MDDLSTVVQRAVALALREALDARETQQPIEWLDTPRAARHLGVSIGRLEVWRCHGGGPPYSKIGRIVRYKVSELDAWMRRHRACEGDAR